MTTVYKQAEGRTVLQEDGSAWPQDGRAIPDTLFFRRRVADGDLVETQPEQPARKVANVAPAPVTHEGAK
ncbi:DUF2635 domain-containing protein [Rhizobium sp. CFBP 8762]|uniref:DUF2635 domain-containing protein n=1 Tax=Rhizobium sp. CFBP 8762 TaxID=2775279 RepID=UPI001784CEB1|nr:DUF2635 domain-containing protein [Rhizobium sp. CFBP 8762]MBD8554917.1 DUF2635 domain-containing protein [Rhizobium sp. CFBP 8762]